MVHPFFKLFPDGNFSSSERAYGYVHWQPQADYIEEQYDRYHESNLLRNRLVADDLHHGQLGEIQRDSFDIHQDSFEIEIQSKIPDKFKKPYRIPSKSPKIPSKIPMEIPSEIKRDHPKPQSQVHEIIPGINHLLPPRAIKKIIKPINDNDACQGSSRDLEFDLSTSSSSLWRTTSSKSRTTNFKKPRRTITTAPKVPSTTITSATKVPSTTTTSATLAPETALKTKTKIMKTNKDGKKSKIWSKATIEHEKSITKKGKMYKMHTLRYKIDSQGPGDPCPEPKFARPNKFAKFSTAKFRMGIGKDFRTMHHDPWFVGMKDPEILRKKSPNIGSSTLCNEIFQPYPMSPFFFPFSANNDLDIKIIGIKGQKWAENWAVSHKAWNALMHALHGNGVIGKLYTEGMPRLDKNITQESFISWFLDFRGWARGQGLYEHIFDRMGASPNDRQEEEAEGLRYLCAAINDHDLRTTVGDNAIGSGIKGFQYLKDLILQGAAIQPTIQAILDNLSMKGDQTAISFKIKFDKYVASLDPRPADRILSTKFANAVLRHTGSMYESCVNAAGAQSNGDNYFAYATLLTRLITEHQNRPGFWQRNDEIKALQTTINAMATEMEKLKNDKGKGPSRNKPNEKNNVNNNNVNKPCRRCTKNHAGGIKQCRKPPVKCPFVLPNGQTCGGDHDISFCFYQDPRRCKDPKLREVIEKKLKKTQTSGTGAHSTEIIGDDESICGLATELTDDDNNTIVAYKTESCQQTPYLIVDSAASATITNDARCITRADLHQPCPNKKIKSGNGTSPIQSFGPLTFSIRDEKGNYQIIHREGYYAPTFSVNLLSVSKDWEDHGTIFNFDKKCNMRMRNGLTFPLLHKNNMFILPYQHESTHVDAHMSSAGMSELLHQRLGHPSLRRLQQVPQQTSSKMIQKCKINLPENYDCPACPTSHMKQAPHITHQPDPEQPLTQAYGDDVHMDLAGPLPPSFPHGHRYADIFVDSHTSIIGGYPLRSKDEHEHMHIQYCSDMASYGGMEIKNFHSDNGGEYTADRYCKLITDSGASKTTIVPRRPNMNPRAEGAFWRIFCIMRALLHHSGIPNCFWPFAFLTAIWIINRLPRYDKNRKQWVTSYELLKGRKPNLDKLRVFGCKAYCIIDKENRENKLGAIAYQGWHLGFSRTQRGWHIYDPVKQRIEVARTVRFVENILYQHQVQPIPAIPAVPSDLPPLESITPTLDNPPSLPPHKKCNTPGCQQRKHHLGNCGPHPVTTSQGLPSSNLRAKFSMTGGTCLDEYMSSDEELEQPEDAHYTIMRQNGYPHEQAKVFAASVKKQKQKIIRDEQGVSTQEVIPRHFREAMKSQYKDKWIEAMQKEMDSHLDPKIMTWEYVPEAEAKGRKLVGSTWAFDIKRNKNGVLTRFKARLCAQGFSQVPYLDYHLTYSHTIRYETLRTLFAVASLLGLKLTGTDIKTAYLHGMLKEVIFMKQPPLFEKYGPNGEELVCRLIRSIYGLKQSGACWEIRLAQALIKYGFKNCLNDPCLWKVKNSKGYALVAVYVDDLVFATSTDDILNDILGFLGTDFELSGTGPLEWLLGTRIMQTMNNKMVTMDQELFITDLLKEYNIQENCKGRVVPVDKEITNLGKIKDGETIDPKFQSLIGKLIWLVLMTRPDIAYATSFLARYASAGTERHMHYALQILKYLAKTKEYKMIFSEEKKDKFHEMIIETSEIEGQEALPAVITFTDASFGGEKPAAGFGVFINGTLVSYSAYRLPTTPLSSAEAEYIAAVRAVTNTIGIRETIAFMIDAENKNKIGIPVTFFQDADISLTLCDNLAAVQISDKNASSKRMKHMATKLAFLREQVQQKQTILYHISTKGMIADIFTKPLLADTFHQLRKYLITLPPK